MTSEYQPDTSPDRTEPFIEITVRLDPEVIRKATVAVFADLFSPPRYNERVGGSGYQALAKQVSEWAKTQDYTQAIQQVARETLAGIVQEVVRDAVAKEVKAQVKVLKDKGGLLNLGGT